MEEKEFTTIASFDIGKKNFAFYIEKIPLNFYIEDIDEDKRYNDDGTPTNEMKTILEHVYKSGKTILHKNLDLTFGCDKKLKLDPLTFHNMYDVLDEYLSYWNMCDIFIIESQMTRLNVMASKLAQHCMSYFIFRYKKAKQVIEFPAYYKTQILGAPKVKGGKKKNGDVKWKAMIKRDRKKWSIKKALEILTLRGEEKYYLNIKTVAKKDDLADTLTQLQAYKYLVLVNKKKFL